MKKNVYIGLGSNQGFKVNHLKKALEHIQEDKEIFIVNTSSFYMSESLGMDENSWFVNQVVEINTTYSPFDLLKRLEDIEISMGRLGKGNNQPREIDIDIIAYNDDVINSEKLNIPHHKMRERLFVLIPLKELNPNWIDPVSNKNISEIIEEVNLKFPDQQISEIKIGR